MSPVSRSLAGMVGDIAHFIAESLRARRRGWRIEPLGPARLRGEDDEIAVVYHEGDQSLWFVGTRGGRGLRDRLIVPGPQAWDATVEPWARGRRAEILERLNTDLYVRRYVEFVEDPP